MIKSLYRYILIAFTLPLVMASCHDEEIDDGMVYQMVLRIPAAEGEMGGLGGATRSESWTPDNPNTDYDNGQTPPSAAEGEHEGLDYYITGKDLKILFCKEDVVIDFAEPTESHFVTASGGFYEFFVKGKLKKIKAGDITPYDVVVLANTKGMLQFDQEHLDNLVGSREDAIYPNLIFNFTAGDFSGVHIPDVAHEFTRRNFTQQDPEHTDQNCEASQPAAARVPMWGRIEGQRLTDGTHVVVPLMRSLAKVRIALDPAITTGVSSDVYTYSIDKIEMIGASTKGTLMPHDAHNKVTSESVPEGSQSKKLSEWWPDSKNVHQSQNIPEGTEHNHLPLEFFKKTESNIDYFYTYVPETVNNTGQYHFNVYLSRHNESTGHTIHQHFRMEFGEYTFNSDNSISGKYMPVMRNHYYMYTIKAVTQDQLIFIDPWDVEVLPPIVM